MPWPFAEYASFGVATPLSELVDRAKNGVFPGGILEFGYPGLAEGNVVNSHIQFDFPRSS